MPLMSLKQQCQSTERNSKHWLQGGRPWKTSTANSGIFDPSPHVQLCTHLPSLHLVDVHFIWSHFNTVSLSLDTNSQYTLRIGLFLFLTQTLFWAMLPSSKLSQVSTVYNGTVCGRPLKLKYLLVSGPHLSAYDIAVHSPLCVDVFYGWL